MSETMAAQVRHLQERLKAAEWQPIETAPKNGVPVLVCSRDGGIDIAYWCTYEVERWQPVRSPFSRTNATHWMPLPAPPVL